VKIKVAVQDSYIPENYTSRLLEACKSLGIGCECFGLISYTDGGFKLTGDITEDRDSLIIPFGSVKLIKLWLEKKLPDNWLIFYDRQGFDASYFNYIQLPTTGKFLKDHLVNGGAFFEDFPVCADYRNIQQDLFCKPASDLKLFHAHIIPAGKSLRETLEEQNTNSSIYSRKEKILFAGVGNIIEEYRCFVVGNSVATSQYKYNGEWLEKATSVPAMMMFFNLLHLYDPTLSGNPYVVDIARVMTDKGSEWRILEYNAFQCSGIYEGIDVRYLLSNLITFIVGKYER
jgi:hypothetical protein